MNRLFSGSLFLLCILLAANVTIAQPGRVYAEPQRPMDHESSTLTVFSENGERFFLILNGVNQNNVPQSRIRVEGLPEFGNDVQIVFADNQTPAIRKRINIADPVDGREVNMTLKIFRDREGFARLKFFNCSEIDHNYRPRGDEYVMSYGQPQQMNNVANPNYTPPPPPAPPPPVAMDPQTFSDVKQSIAGASFDDTKLSTAKSAVGNNYVSTDQVIEICRLLSFENTRLDFAKFAYSRTIDQGSYYKVGSVLDFDSNKQALNDFISRGGK